MRYIHRTHDYFGWRVWITYGEISSGQVYFGDATHGGKDAALAAARRYRDEFVKKHRIPFRHYDGNGYCVKSKTARGDAVGVRLACHKRPGTWSVYWVAQWQENGHITRKWFSVRKYGYQPAWMAAAYARARAIGRPVPRKTPPMPEWVKNWAAKDDLDI